MPNLPVSLRLSLWATRALGGGVDVDDAVRLSSPDADHLEGARPVLETWRDLGERVVLPALARPGDLTHLPRGDAAFVAAAADAGECVFVPGLGGALVPDVAEFGPEGDRGLAVRWRAHDTHPFPPHVLDAWSLREVERELANVMIEVADVLTDAAAGPWASRGPRELAEERLDTTTWGLPDGVPTRAAALIARAGIVGAAARLGLETPDDGVVGRDVARRRAALIALAADADRALTRAGAVAALALAGLRPGRDD